MARASGDSAASALVLVVHLAAAPADHRSGRAGHPLDFEVAEGVALVEGDPALLEQLEQGQEPDDDLDPGGQVPGQVAEGGRVPRRGRRTGRARPRPRPPSPRPTVTW